MLKPWALIIWTTCSLKSVSNILLDFGLLTVHAISVFNNLSGCLFLLDHCNLGYQLNLYASPHWNLRYPKCAAGM